MALPSSGTITMAMIATELGISPTGLSLNDSRVRTLAGVPSGAISMSNLYGKSNVFSTIMTVGGENSGRYRGYSSSASGSGYTNAAYGSMQSSASPYGTIAFLFWGTDGLYLLINGLAAQTVVTITVDGQTPTQFRNGVYEYWDENTANLEAKLNIIKYPGNTGLVTVKV